MASYVGQKISKNGLEHLAGISHHSMLKLGRDEDVSTEVLTKICGALGCEVQDIVDFFPVKSNDEELNEIREIK